MKNLTPITRKEMFMAKAAGQEVTTPDPITREEMFLSDIAEHEEGQGGGGSGGGTLYVTFNLEEDGETYTADKTLAEISAAVTGGMVVCGYYNGMIFNLDNVVGEAHFVNVSMSIYNSELTVGLDEFFVGESEVFYQQGSIKVS